MKHSITKKVFKNQFFYFLGVLLILISWEFGSLFYNNNIILPSVFNTFKALFELLKDGYTYKVVLNTLFRLVVVIAISFIIALSLSILAYWKEWIKKIISPLMLLLKTLPVASIIIILLIFIGHQLSPYYITAFVILPIIYEGLLQGLNDINNDILDEIKLQSNTNLIVIKDVYFPMIKTNIFTSLLQSFGLGLKVMVMAEFIAQPTYSIGRELLTQKNNLEYEKVFAWTVILVFIVIIFEMLIRLLKKKYLL